MNMLRRGQLPADAPAADEAMPTRHLQALRLAALGLSYAEIGRHMHVSEATAKSYVRGAGRQLGARNRMHAVSRAHELGLIAPDGERLVRDRIPTIAPQHTYRRATHGELPALLRAALLEAAAAVATAPSRTAIVAELGDLLEVMTALAARSGIPMDDVRDAARRTRAAHGAFSKGWVLVPPEASDEIDT